MKKLFDRRMVAYYVGVAAVYGLACKVVDPVQQGSVITMAFNILLGFFTGLVAGNVVQAIKQPKE